jgi:hypothetical protein
MRRDVVAIMIAGAVWVQGCTGGSGSYGECLENVNRAHTLISDDIMLDARRASGTRSTELAEAKLLVLELRGAHLPDDPKAYCRALERLRKDYRIRWER